MPLQLIYLHGQSELRCDHDIDKHFQGYYTLQYMSAGAVELNVDDKQYLLHGPWFWSAYPGPQITFHSAGRTGTWEHHYVAFRGPRVAGWIEAGLFPVMPQPAPPWPDLTRRFDEMLRLFATNDRLPGLRATHILEGILLDLAEARMRATQKPDWLESAIRAIDASIGQQELDYQQLCRDLGVSESTLRRGFIQTLGVSPHNYLIKARIARAKHLLGESDLPIKAIAETLAYADVYYFARQFRQVTGLPPAAYRKSIEHGPTPNPP